jgi:hypothetical protein
MENVGIFYAHLEYIMAIWYILWQFGKSPLWVYYVKKNLATLIPTYTNKGSKITYNCEKSSRTTLIWPSL